MAVNYADRVQTKQRTVGKFIVLYGPHGIGKTTFAAQAEDCIFIQAKDKSLDVLADSGIIPLKPNISVESWEDAMGALNWLATPGHGYRVAVIDGASGLEEFCDASVVRDEFRGNRDKFLAFGNGHKIAADRWSDALNAIERIKEIGVTVILLAHRGLSEVKNAEGNNYYKFMPGLNMLKFTPTAQYSDAVLRMDYVLEVRDVNDLTKKGKASGSSKRYLFCEGEVSFEAKNRLGLPPLIELGNQGHEEAWGRFIAALAAGREK